MKYIKTYEKRKYVKKQNFEIEIKPYYDYKYKKGDYVLLVDDPSFRWTCYLVVKIINVTTQYRSSMPYTFLAIDKKRNEEIELSHMEQYTIQRLATQEEIERIELILKANKYNL
jgi:hypothetical protein